MTHEKDLRKLLMAIGMCLAVLCTSPVARAESPTGSIPALRARVTSLRFFEGPTNPAPRERRVYRERFEVSKLRYVYWELDLEHPAPGRQLPFLIEEFWYHQDTLLTRQSLRASLRADWTWSYWYHSFDLVADGKRHIGWRRVDLYVEGVKVASQQFELYDATCRGQLSFAEADKVQEYERLADQYRRRGDQASYRETRNKLIVAYHNRAGTCYINGNLEAAIEHFNKALTIAPDYDLAYRNRGKVRAEMGDLSGAMEDYDRAIRLDPQDAEYYDSRAMARFWLGSMPAHCAIWMRRSASTPRGPSSMSTAV